MSVSFTEKILLAFVAVNLTLVLLLYRYTKTDAPMMLILQLMVPLIIWQIVLGVSFFPDEFIAQFLDEFYGHDGAAGDQPFNQTSPNLITTIHSHGDVPQTPLMTVADEQVSFDFLF